MDLWEGRNSHDLSNGLGSYLAAAGLGLDFCVCCKLDVKATILIREEANLGWIGKRRMHANESNLQKVLSSLRRKANGELKVKRWMTFVSTEGRRSISDGMTATCWTPTSSSVQVKSSPTSRLSGPPAMQTGLDASNSIVVDR